MPMEGGRESNDCSAATRSPRSRAKKRQPSAPGGQRRARRAERTARGIAQPPRRDALATTRVRAAAPAFLCPPRRLRCQSVALGASRPCSSGPRAWPCRCRWHRPPPALPPPLAAGVAAWQTQSGSPRSAPLATLRRSPRRACCCSCARRSRRARQRCRPSPRRATQPETTRTPPAAALTGCTAAGPPLHGSVCSCGTRAIDRRARSIGAPAATCHWQTRVPPRSALATRRPSD